MSVHSTGLGKDEPLVEARRASRCSTAEIPTCTAIAAQEVESYKDGKSHARSSHFDQGVHRPADRGEPLSGCIPVAQNARARQAV